MTITPLTQRTRPPRSHRDPEPEPELLFRRWWHGLPQTLLLVVAAVGDAANFTAALGVVAAEMSLPVLVAVVAALTCAAVGLMHFAGVSLKRRHGSGRSGPGLPVVSLTVTWLLLGLSSFALRVVAPPAEAAPAEASVFGAVESVAPAPVASGPDAVTWALSGMMLALYVATGAMACWAAYTGHVPEQRAHARAARARKRAQRRLREAEPRLVALEERRSHELADQARDAERYVAARDACDAWSRELKEHVRLRVAAALSDPAASSTLTART